MKSIPGAWQVFPAGNKASARYFFKGIWVIGALLSIFSFSPDVAQAQQAIVFTVEGKTYHANVSWVIKHNNTDFKAQTDHSFDLASDRSIFLAVNFKFENDSLPPDNDVLWGFQFNPTSDLLSPPGAEKRSRSNNQFQRFTVSHPGNGALVITPKAWRKAAGGRFDVLVLGQSITLNFNFTDSSQPAPASGNTTAANPATAAGPAGDDNKRPEPAAPPAADLELPQEEVAFTAATNVEDTIQKIKALMDFVDKYSATKPKSELVAKAIRNVPLGISVPVDKGDGTYTYLLNYASKPVIDSTQIRGWSWRLSEARFGRYELVLTDLKDTVHYFKLADSGKNAPFNAPKELRPFEKIRIRLLSEKGDSFRLEARGGTPPFIVFLSQDGFPQERYIMEQTDTTWAFSKTDCGLCRTGAYTLEVYSNDFSTLLLREEKAIHVRKISYLLLLLCTVVGTPVVYYGFRYLRRLWVRLRFQWKLRQIEAWENREAKESERRKPS